MSTETLRVASALTLFDPDDEPIPAHDVHARLEYTDGQVAEYVISFAVSPDTWARIDQGGWFNMPPEARGETFAGGFNDQPEIEIEARLDAGMLDYVNAHSTDAFEAAALLLKASRDPDHPFGHSESWYGLYVKQQRAPKIKAGFATRWSGLTE